MAECDNEIKKIQEVVTLRIQQSEQVKKEKEEKAAAAAEAAAAAVPKYVDCIVPALEAVPLCHRTLDVASEGGAEMSNKKLKTEVSALLYNTHIVIRNVNAGAQFLVLPLCAVCQSVCMAVIYSFIRLTLILYFVYLPLTRTHLSPVWQEQIEQQVLQQEQSQTVDQVRATKPGLLSDCAVCSC